MFEGVQSLLLWCALDVERRPGHVLSLHIGLAATRGTGCVALKVSVKGCYSLLSVGCSKENVHQVQLLLEFPMGHCSSASQPQAPWLKCCPIITLWIEMSESQLWFEICSERNPYYLNLQNTLEFRILGWSPVAFGPLITAGKQQRGKVLTLPVCVKTLRKI